MACSYCDHKGFIETKIQRDADLKSMIAQCPKCKDIQAYSKRVQQGEFFSSGPPPRTQLEEIRGRECEIIPFPKKGR